MTSSIRGAKTTLCIEQETSDVITRMNDITQTAQGKENRV